MFYDGGHSLQFLRNFWKRKKYFNKKITPHILTHHKVSLTKYEDRHFFHHVLPLTRSPQKVALNYVPSWNVVTVGSEKLLASNNCQHSHSSFRLSNITVSLETYPFYPTLTLLQLFGKVPPDAFRTKGNETVSGSTRHRSTASVCIHSYSNPFP